MELSTRTATRTAASRPGYKQMVLFHALVLPHVDIVLYVKRVVPEDDASLVASYIAYPIASKIGGRQ